MAATKVFGVSDTGKTIELIDIDDLPTGGITDGSVTNTKLADEAQSTIKGRAAGAGTGAPQDLTAAQARTVLNVADGSTANSSDATLLARANHTGTQLSTTISDMVEAVQDIVGAEIVAGTNMTVTYNDVAGTITLDAAAGVPGADSVTNTILANMAADTIKGRANGAGTGDPTDLTATQVRTILNVASGATANSSDATLLARANHTGTQTASTISDFSEAVDDRVGALVVAGTNILVTYNDGAGTLTIDNTAAGLGTDSVANTNLTNMAVNTIKGRITAGTGDPEDLTAAQARTVLNVADGATLNSSDATLLARANHTGTQLSTTISDFTEAVQDVAGAAIVAGTNVTVTYNDGAGTVTIDAASGSPAANSITNVLMADMATQTFKGRNTAGTGDPEDLSATTARTILNVANGATANSSDATLLARANHTGTQLSTTISDFNEAVQDVAGAAIIAGTGMTVTYNDGAGTITLDASTAASGNFTPTGTGASVRTMDVKMREVELSVIDYGADKTGVADSSTAFANALNAATAGCRKLRIPAGTYRLNSKWMIDKQCHIFGDGREETIINTYGTTDHAVEIQRDSGLGASTLIRMEDLTFQRGSGTMGAGFHGMAVKAKVDMRNVQVRNYTNHGIWYETSTGGVTGAVFFSRMDGVWSKDNGGDGIQVRNGANADVFMNCQFDRNGGVGFHHLTDGNPTYGSIIIAGQCSYNTSYGYYFESGTDLQAYGLYAEFNGSPTNTNTDGYVNTPFDFYIGDNVSRSHINIGTLFGASTTHVRAPSRGLNDGCAVYQGGRRIYSSTAYMTASEGPATATNATANATDLASAITLVNSLKSTLNTLLANLRTGNSLSP